MDDRVQAVRAFNRFYTRQIGLLEEGLLSSPYSLTEVRVLYELAHSQAVTAKALSQTLGLDPGYLSRILRKFEERRFLEREVKQEDQRSAALSLTRKGKKEFEPLDSASNAQIRAMLSKLGEPGQNKLLTAMHAIQDLLTEDDKSREPYLLRPHRPGDMGWVVYRHGALYSQEYGWDERFEALVAEIVAEFVKNYDPKRERCWIAERKGEIVGSVFLVKKDDVTAKLRLLYVEPSARGLGIGKRLVDECLRFARQVGYQKITLWTQSNLMVARGIYEKAGFHIVARNNNKSFGKELVAETWEKVI
ncbi:MAG: bifunctional helix-turn-helix transcriptional regulator/GNAT family N-acetyltransferase [Terriglobales bacterium]